VSFDDVLRRMPQSTDAWSCPWFESLLVCFIAAAALGFSSAKVLGLVPAVLAVAVIGWLLGTRKRGGAAC